jgi:hypothetical protein
MCARSWICSLTSEPRASPHPAARPARRARTTALDPLALRAIARRREHIVDALVLDDRRPVCVEHDHVAGPDHGTPDGHGLADRPGEVLAGPLDTYPACPDRQLQLDQLLEIADRGVDQDCGGTVGLGLGRQQLTDERDRPRLGHRQHEHLARLDLGHRRMHHQIVVLPATDRPRRARDTGPRHNLVQVGVDVAASAAGLVNGRRAECRQLLHEGAHSAPTTCGVTRWNASAWRISALPDDRRA